MLRRLFFDNLDVWTPSWILLAPDSGAGSGDAGDDDGSGEGDGGSSRNDDDEPKYSEKDLRDRIENAVKSRLNKANRDLRLKDHDIQKLQDENSKLKERLDEAEATIKSYAENPDKRNEGEIDNLTKKFERETAALRAELEQEKKARETAEKARRDSLRDRMLDEALVAVGCKDMRAGRRIFLPQIKWDEVDQNFMFEKENGTMVEIRDGVEEEMPDYLKPPAMRGGSGSEPMNAKQRARRTELDKQERDLADLQKKLQANPNDRSLLTQISVSKRNIKRLKAELD